MDFPIVTRDLMRFLECRGPNLGNFCFHMEKSRLAFESRALIVMVNR